MKVRVYGLVMLMMLAVMGASSLGAQETTCEAGFRLIVHEMGETCVPETVERVVALNPAALEFAILSGKTVVGAQGWVVSEFLYIAPHLQNAVADVVDVGFPPNPEIILSLTPDLIMGQAEESLITAYPSFEAIAPTIIQPVETNVNWQVSAEFWSSVFGNEDLFVEMQESYQTRIAALSEALNEPSELEVSVLVASSPQFTFAYLPNTPVGTILADAGIGRAESQREPTERAIVPISAETLDLADGDAIFVFGYPYTDADAVAEQEAYLTEFTEDPIWQALSAVQNGRVYRVGDYWYRGIYFLATQQIIDDLFTHLAGVEPAEISPNPYFPIEAEAMPEITESAP